MITLTFEQANELAQEIRDKMECSDRDGADYCAFCYGSRRSHQGRWNGEGYTESPISHRVDCAGEKWLRILEGCTECARPQDDTIHSLEESNRSTRHRFTRA